jgi:sialidase-1
VATANNVLLAYCEARRRLEGDWGAIDLLLRRSVDGGNTWSAPQQMNYLPERIPRNPAVAGQPFADPNDQTCNNPVAIADRQPGVVHFLFCAEYMRCFYLRSTDDGLTWSAPREITSAVEELRLQYRWRVVAIGPGHGIQHASGRLLAPIWLSTGEGEHGHRPSVAATIYSDDGGITWHAGEIFAANEPGQLNPSEATLVELDDGRVMVNLRTESPHHRRMVAASPDGATRWSHPFPDPALYEPVCFASLARLDQKRLVFTHPDSQHTPSPDPTRPELDRHNLTIRLSYDEGRTWPISKVIDPNLAGYSDLAVDAQGMIFCAYEGGGLDGNPYLCTHLSVARFNLSWLTNGKDIEL